MAVGPSICKRFILTFVHVITGCLFFYIVLVGLSYYSVGTTLDLLPYNAWSRMASRATGAAAAVPFAMQLTTRASRTASLFWATWTCCAFAVHMMIVATDTKILDDVSYHTELVRQGGHPLLSLIPRKLAIGLGATAYLFLTLAGLERTYGPGLGNRREQYPRFVTFMLTYVTGVYFAFFSDRLLNAVLKKHELELIAYPAAFLLALAISITIFLRRNLSEPDFDYQLAEEKILLGKKPNGIVHEQVEKLKSQKKNE